jgi:hypothetical protein
MTYETTSDDEGGFIDEIRKIGNGAARANTAAEMSDAESDGEQEAAPELGDDILETRAKSDTGLRARLRALMARRQKAEAAPAAAPEAAAENGPQKKALPTPIDLNDEKNLENESLEDKRLVAKMASRRATLAKTEAARLGLPSLSSVKNNMRAAKSNLSIVSVTLQEITGELNTVREEVANAKANTAKIRTGQQPFGCPPVPAATPEMQKCFEFLEKRLNTTSKTMDAILEKLATIDRAFIVGRRDCEGVVDALLRYCEPEE